MQKISTIEQSLVKQVGQKKTKDGFLKEWRKTTVQEKTSKFTSAIEFISAMNYTETIKHSINTPMKQLICSNDPKLHELEYLYSTESVEDLIGTYLFNFQGLLNIKDENKLNQQQIQAVTYNILSRCRGLTIPEIAMMFYRFSTGEFGRFYGNIDIMILGEWVAEFMKKRGSIIISDQEVKAFILKRDQNYDQK